MTIDTRALSELERAARRGESKAFGRLIELWDRELRSVVWSIVRSASGTDDVMQSAYEKAFRSIGSFRGDAALKTWLHRICYRAALDHVRYERRRHHTSVTVLHDRASGESTSETALAHAELASVLAQLEPDTRALLMLTAGLGCTFDETASITGLARGTVASRVGRAKKVLREHRRSTEWTVT